MKNSKLFIIMIFCLIVIINKYNFAFSDSKNEIKQVVRIEKIKKDKATSWVTCSGFVTPVKRILIVSEITGIISKLNFDTGDRIKIGDNLVEINNPQIESRLKKAKAMLEMKKTSLKRLENFRKDEAILDLSSVKRDFEIAEAEFIKLENDYSSKIMLKKRGISSNELASVKVSKDQAESRFKYLKTEFEIKSKFFEEKKWELDIENGKSDFNMSKSDFDSSEVDKDRLSIKSPINGILSSRFVEIGQFVNSGSKILELFDDFSIQIDSYLPENSIDSVNINQRVEVTIGNKKLDGKVTLISPELEREKSGFLVRIKIENIDGKIKVGRYALCKILVKEKKNAFFIPRGAIVEENGIKKIFQLIDGEKIIENFVKTGIEEENRIEIISGFDIKLPIIIEGIYGLKNGELVEVIKKGKSDKK